MVKVKTYPWDPADRIETGEDAVMFLRISLEDYDSTVFGALMDCIARSKGVAEIKTCEFHVQNGVRSVTVTTVNGASATIVIAPNVDADSIRNALVPTPAPEPISP